MYHGQYLEGDERCCLLDVDLLTITFTQTVQAWIQHFAVGGAKIFQSDHAHF